MKLHLSKAIETELTIKILNYLKRQNIIDYETYNYLINKIGE